MCPVSHEVFASCDGELVTVDPLSGSRSTIAQFTFAGTPISRLHFLSFGSEGQLFAVVLSGDMPGCQSDVIVSINTVTADLEIVIETGRGTVVLSIKE